MEKWRIITEAPNFLVSNKGRVKNTKTGRIIKVHNNKGYPSVYLNAGGRPLPRYLHRVVASAFVDGEKSGLVVNHIDGDRGNYLPENLEWITQKENIAHAKSIGRIRKLKKWLVQEDGSLKEIVEENE